MAKDEGDGAATAEAMPQPSASDTPAEEPATEDAEDAATCPTCGRPLNPGEVPAPVGTSCQRCGAMGDVARVDHLGKMKDLCPQCQDKYHNLGQLRGEESADEDPWRHIGGGYFENRETGERQRGHP